jgi:hypothetical protein
LQTFNVPLRVRNYSDGGLVKLIRLGYNPRTPLLGGFDMRLRSLAFALVVCGAAAGCGGGSSEKAAAPATSTAAAPAAKAATPAASGAAEFGVPECDDYLKKYLACIDSKVPESGRAMARQAVEQTKASWKQAASTPQGKDGLAMGCKAATDAAKQSMAAYGCTW